MDMRLAQEGKGQRQFLLTHIALEEDAVLHLLKSAGRTHPWNMMGNAALFMDVTLNPMNSMLDLALITVPNAGNPQKTKLAFSRFARKK
jgi:hypothetical protein